MSGIVPTSALFPATQRIAHAWQRLLWGNLPHSLIARVVAESRRKADSQMPKKLGLEDQAEFVSRFSVPRRQA
jgi:hypothetical protein